MRPSIVRSLLLLAAVSAHAPLAHAQSPARRQPGPGAISGTVVSAADGRPLASATIVVRRMADSVLVGGKIADREGAFRVEGLPAGSYLLEVTARGWSPRVERGLALSAESPTREIGVIRMEQAAVAIQGVVAQGQRSAVVFAPDRSIYNVRDMPLVQGGTATDALRTVPELRVDADDNITARGASPAVHVNGRPASMQGEALILFLRGLPAERIDRIEYIPNPPARFEADGQGGIVNIVLRQDPSLGLSGTLSANAGTERSAGSSARINYQQGRVTLFGGGSLATGGGASTAYDLRENRVSQPITFMEQSTDREQRGSSGGLDLTAELKLTPRSTFWSAVRGNWGESAQEINSQLVQMDAARLPANRFDRLNNVTVDNQQLYAAVGLRRVVQAARNEFSTELRYAKNGAHADNQIERYLRAVTGQPLSQSPDLSIVDGRNDNWNVTFQADLSKPLSANSRIDVGYRALLRNNQNQEFRFDDPAGAALGRHEVGHDLFRYDERFNATYLTLDRRQGKLGVQAGVRAELANTRIRIPTTGEEFENDYGALYPNANLAYEVGTGKQLRFSYSRRIDRPGTGLLNPINTAPTDPFNRVVGNPHLDPSYTNSFSLDGTWSGKRGSIRLSPFYYHRTGVWERIRHVDANSISTVRAENTASIDHYGVQTSLTLAQTGPFSGSLSMYAFRQDRDARNHANAVSGVSTNWSVDSNVGIRLSPTLNAQLLSSYIPAQTLPQGTTSALWQSSIAVRKQLLANRASLNLSVVDPLDRYRSNFTTTDRLHTQVGRSHPGLRRATLSVSYNFGRTPQANRRVVQDAPAAQTPTVPVDIR